MACLPALQAGFAGRHLLYNTIYSVTFIRADRSIAGKEYPMKFNCSFYNNQPGANDN